MAECSSSSSTQQVHTILLFPTSRLPQSTHDGCAGTCDGHTDQCPGHVSDGLGQYALNSASHLHAWRLQDHQHSRTQQHSAGAHQRTSLIPAGFGAPLMDLLPAPMGLLTSALAVPGMVLGSILETNALPDLGGSSNANSGEYSQQPALSAGGCAATCDQISLLVPCKCESCRDCKDLFLGKMGKNITLWSIGVARSAQRIRKSHKMTVLPEMLLLREECLAMKVHDDLQVSLGEP